MGLTQQLEEKTKASKEAMPEHALAAMEQANSELIKNKVGENAIKVGQTFPDKELTNAKSQSFKISAATKDSNFLKSRNQ